MATKTETLTESTELDRFLKLHDGMAAMNRDWLARSPADRLDWSPSDDPIHRFGDGRTPVTIRNLFIHVTVAERAWIGALKAAKDGGQMPGPSDPELARSVTRGDLVEAVGRAHRHTMSIARSMTAADLAKTVISARRRWTGMEFLWGVHAHRAFHLGHLDLYLRFSNTPTPEFFVFHPDAIG